MADYTLNVGDEAPDVSLNLWPEDTRNISDYRGQWLIVYFYPKDNTSGCTTESCEFRDALPDFSSANAAVIGVSRDSLASHQRFSEKYGFQFPLASDGDEVVCKAFDVIQIKKLYGKESLGVERSTFIINPEGDIAYAWRNVRVKEHVSKVLAAIQELQKS